MNVLDTLPRPAGLPAWMDAIDPVCRCGHGRSVHAADIRSRCDACVAIVELRERLPAGAACAAFVD
jgi:hypothetical protein